MNALLASLESAPLPAGDTRPLSDAALQGLRWALIAALIVAAAALLSSGRDTFATDVAAQVASGGGQQGLSASAELDEPDPFRQQKLDAKFEELPAQF